MKSESSPIRFVLVSNPRIASCNPYRTSARPNGISLIPRGMSEMPFGRADVRYGLHDAILGFETNTKRIGELSDFMEAIPQSLDPRLARGKKRSFRRRRCGDGFNGRRAHGF